MAAMPKLPICVMRPTIVVGDSQTGEVDRFDGPYFLILLIVTSPSEIPIALPGRPEASMHLVPVDYYVRAACALGRDPRSPGRTFHGRVSYILPQVDPATRTLKVRLQFDNPGFVLKPDMYGEVQFQTGGAIRSGPMSFQSGDKQYVAIAGGHALFVFALE